nr:DUF1499 domain-containing protein [uncultured Desulfobulbus sp.]
MKHNRSSWFWKGELVAFGLSLLAILAFRLQWLTWRPALLLMAAALAAVILIGFLSLLVLFAKLRSGRHQGASGHCLLAALFSLPVLIGFLILGMRGAKVPPIHDITTDAVHPPMFIVAAGERTPADNSPAYQGPDLFAQQQQTYRDIKPIESSLSPAQAFAKALATAQELGWRIIAPNATQGTIEASEKSPIFGFIDDIAIRITATADGSRIDLRSASRAGVSDLGVNAKRIGKFIQQFNKPSA